MQWNIPGTVLTVDQAELPYLEQKFRDMFLGGGIVLSQVAGITGLEPYTIQNWVKRGFLTNPVHKKYTLRQLCRIININMLKSVLPMERICGLLTYINGHLDDTSDDIIDDSKLYFIFVRLAAHYRVMHDTTGRDEMIDRELENYAEPVSGAKERVKKVLRVMLTAWASAQLRQVAERMMEDLK